MVLAERNQELVRNGRRSRGPSPNSGHGGSSSGAGGASSVGSTSGVGSSISITNNGTGGGGHGGSVGIQTVSTGNINNNAGVVTPETSSDDDNSIKRNGKSKTKQSEYEEKIRVGRDYQAVCPPLIPEQERRPDILNERALLVWSPTKDIPDSKLEEYIAVAKEKYGYNGEQALGMLFWHKHDLERAVMDLANFTPFPDEWTTEDKVLFEQAFQFHGKSFHRIRQMLPDKSIASLVKYYYSWKKTRHRQSVMDRQEKAKANSKEGSENGSEGNASNDDSDNDDKVQLNKQEMSALKAKCDEMSDDIRPPEQVTRINARWTSDELDLAVQAVQKFGKNFAAIAEFMGTKTEAHIKTFYTNYRRRYNLDQLAKKYEADKEAAAAAAAALAAEEAATSLAVNAEVDPEVIAPEVSIAESGNLEIASASNTTSNASNKKEETKKQKETLSANGPLTDKAAASILLEDEDKEMLDDVTATKTAAAKPTDTTTTITIEDDKDERNDDDVMTKNPTTGAGAAGSSTGRKPQKVVMEQIDLDNDQEDLEDILPPTKKMALTVANQDLPKASVA